MNFEKERYEASQRHLNLFGLFEGPDENYEREKRYQEAKNKYPIDPVLSDCYHLESVIKNLNQVIDAAYQSRTLKDSKGNQRVQNRTIDAYTKYLNEVKSLYNEKVCDKVKSDQEAKEFFDTQYENLERVKQLGDAASNTTKYIVFGMLAVVIVAAGVIIFKKKK